MVLTGRFGMEDPSEEEEEADIVGR
jgi:hypothetical protein